MRRAVAVVMLGLVMGGTALAQTSQPSGGGLEVAANEAFGAGRYAVALPMVLLYFDVRVRKEGYDVELLAQEMGEGSAGSGPYVSPA